MPIPNVTQPNVIKINDDLRLKQFDLTYKNYQIAFPWYEDVETVYAVDGIRESYDMEKLQRMYSYLYERGELYFIERKISDTFQPIGDVTFWQFNMPIVIGDITNRGRGIGKSVIETLVQRGKHLGYETLYVEEIYKFNLASQKTFESIGFVRSEETENGYRYCLDIKDNT